MRPNLSAAAPDSQRLRRSGPRRRRRRPRARRAPAPRRRAPPSRPRARASTAVAGQRIHHLDHLERVAGGGGQRLVHVGDQRRGRQPAPFAVSTSARGQRLAPPSSVFMKAPEPVLTSSTSASSPAASFFDRIEAVIRAIDLDRRRSRRGWRRAAGRRARDRRSGR